jgi:hypothetical protein
MKFWISEKGNDKVIVIDEKVIYNNNPSRSKLYEIQNQLRNGNIPPTLSGTPFNYIKKISSNSNSQKFEIQFGHKNKLIIDAQENKEAILEHLKSDPINQPMYKEYPQKWYKVVYKPLVSLGLIGLVFARTYEIAYNMELDYDYIVTGAGIAMMQVGLAEILGSKVILSIGILLVAIILYRVIKKLAAKSIVEELIYNKK